MNNFQRNIHRTVTTLYDDLEISCTLPTIQGEGTVEFTGGQPFETIDLAFSITVSDVNFNSLTLDAPIGVPSLTPLNLTELGNVILDSNGDASADFLWNLTTTNSICLVEIVGRSSIYDVPIINRSAFIQNI